MQKCLPITSSSVTLDSVKKSLYVQLCMYTYKYNFSCLWCFFKNSDFIHLDTRYFWKWTDHIILIFMVGFLWSLFRVSSPDHIFLPIPNWKYKENPETEEVLHLWRGLKPASHTAQACTGWRVTWDQSLLPWSIGAPWWSSFCYKPRVGMEEVQRG